MLRSMYSGISGLKNFQTKLDVIGNNISNVNTYGFKKGRTVFKDLISQTVSGASASTGIRGGVNPKQVGLGSQIASIDTLHSGGSLQSTGNTLDLAISGDGFFQVAEGNSTVPTGYNKIQYTRAGNFYMDNNGYLVNSDGKYLVGFSSYASTEYTKLIDDPDNPGTLIDSGLDPIKIDIYPQANQITGPFDFSNPTAPIYMDGETSIEVTGYSEDMDFTDGTDASVNYQPIKIPTNAQSMSIGQDGTVTFVDEFGTLRWAGQLVLSKFSNTGGLEKVGGNYFQETTNSGQPVLNFANQGGNGSINSGFLEMSNVDLSEEFTEMIVAQRGFQANTRIITTSDEILQELVNLKR